MKRWLALSVLAGSLLSAQTLLFKSGFESATNLGAVQCCYGQLLTGTDSSTGYAWNNWPFNGSTPIELHLEPGGGSTSEFFNGIDTAQAHSGSRSLHLKIAGAPSSCCPQVPLQSSGNPIKSVYYRAWQYFGTSEQTFLSGNSGFYYHMGTEYKSLDDFRSQLSFNTISSTHSLQPHMQSDMGGINCSNNSSNACNWIDPITGATVHDQPVSRHYADIDNTSITIPFGQWFLVETYWKRSKGTDGVFATALNGKTIGSATGPTYGNLAEELQDAYWFNLYHNTTNPNGEEWIDDIELWDSPPCGTFPCGSGNTTTWTGAVPPFMSNHPGVIGTVGVSMSIPITSTGNPTNFFMSGGLPSGLSINSSTGTISGTPGSAGTTRTYVEATNSVGKGAMWLEFQINNVAVSPPSISSFTANASTIAAGQWSRLQWVQSGAASLTLTPGSINVTGADPFPVNPGTTTTYTLTATNAAGTDSKSATVTVSGTMPLPTISAFTATPSSITSGGSSTLAWSTSGATALSIDQSVGTVTGTLSRIVTPTANTTYTLTASNSAGSVTRSVAVSVAGSLPVINSFTATPSTPIVPGASVSLAWTSTDGTSATLNGSPVALSGTQTVTPLVTTAYVLVVSNSSGPVSRTATVTVGALPVISSFTATPSTVALGSSSTLALASTGGTTCSIDQGVGAVSCNSSTTVSPLTSKLYTATVTNSFGSKTAAALVGVSISALVGAAVVNGQVVIH